MAAELDSVWSTCIRKKVGSIVIDGDGIILATGRNGAPIGMPHCYEINKNPGERCKYCIHSERNTINHAAKRGTSLANSTIITLYRPCEGCAKDIIQAGIIAVYYRWDYDSDDNKQYVFDLFKRATVYYEQLDFTSQEQEFSEWLEIWSRSMLQNTYSQ